MINDHSVIAFMGVINAGKDYQCEKLIEQGYKHINFADSLRNMCWKLLNWKPSSVEEYEWFKKTDIALIGGHILGSQKTVLTGRQFMQNVGRTMREIDPDFWARQWYNETLKAVSNGERVCCSDLRFLENELKYLMKHNDSLLVLSDYKSDNYNATDTDISEQSAQWMLKQGYKHMQEFDHYMMKQLQKKYVLDFNL